jgi:16S rRNA (cytosine1402-N4)-methyltransferase
MVKFQHQSVMPSQVMDLLVKNHQGVYVDATLGAGGHAGLLLKSWPQVRVVGIDQDVHAIANAEEALESYRPRVTVLKGNFRYLTALLASIGVEEVDGVLMDLGVSSPQLDMLERGFTYQQADAPLDMRMDDDNPITAFRLVNQKSEREIADALKRWGEERWAARIAQFIVRSRQVEPIRTSGQLVEIIRAAIPAAARRSGGHPARRTFQALRIWVNDELGALDDGLNEAWHVLKPDGRLAVIAFHSLEDRIVKQRFREWNTTGEGRLITKHPVTAEGDEVAENPRSRSAKLRVVEKQSL